MSYILLILTKYITSQYLLFGWSVPEIIKCSREPCLLTVHCYVSRPKEKQVFMMFMFAVGVICMMLNFLELAFLLFKRVKWSVSDVKKVQQSTNSSQLSLHERITERKIPRYSSAPPGYYIPDVESRMTGGPPLPPFPMVRIKRASLSCSDDESSFLSEEDRSFYEYKRRTSLTNNF